MEKKSEAAKENAGKIAFPPRSNNKARILDSKPMEGYIRCPACGAETPGENFNCIFCSAPLPSTAGVFGAMRYGWKGFFWAGAALLLILSLLLRLLAS